MQSQGDKHGPDGAIKDEMREEVERIERREARERRNRGVVYNLRAHPRITLVVFAVAAFFVWRLMDKMVQTDTEMIHETIQDFATGMDKGGEEGQAMVLNALSKDFQLDMFNYQMVEGLLPYWMAVEDFWVGKPQIGGVQITGDKATVDRLYIGAGRGSEKGTSTWKVKLQKESDGRWRIVGGELTHLLNKETDRSPGSVFNSYSGGM